MKRVELLEACFCIDIATLSVMNNHFHIILRTRPEQTETLSNEEVAYRWLSSLPQRFNEKGTPLIPENAEVSRVAEDKEKIAILRKKLSSVSYFMAHLNESIARRANAEDKGKGRFFEGRFKSIALLDEAAILACMAYVDLNPVRAFLEDTPEKSEFTGAYERIRARQGAKKLEALKEIQRTDLPTPTPNTLKEEHLNETQKKEIQKAESDCNRDQWLCPIDNRNTANKQLTFDEIIEAANRNKSNRTSLDYGKGKGLFPVTTDEYLTLLDWTGRQLRPGKRGIIPEDLAPILDRLSIKVDDWLRMVESFGDMFWRVVGKVDAIIKAAQAAGRKWFKGMAANRTIFGQE